MRGVQYGWGLPLRKGRDARVAGGEDLGSSWLFSSVIFYVAVNRLALSASCFCFKSILTTRPQHQRDLSPWTPRLHLSSDSETQHLL